MNLQEFLNSKVLEIKNRESQKGDFFIDQNNHKWYFDGETWSDIGLNTTENYVQGYGIVISEGIVSIDTNIVAEKSDIIDPKIIVNEFGDIKNIEFIGTNVSNDINDTTKVKVDFSSFVKDDVLSEVAKTGSYNDLKDVPESYKLPVSTPTQIGGVKVDGITVLSDDEGNISVPIATNVTRGLVKLSSDYLGESKDLVPTEYAVRSAFVEMKTRSFCYISYADDKNGSNWSVNPYKGLAIEGEALKTNDFRKYRAEIVVEHEITRDLTEEDFANAEWVKFVGDDVYLYMGYASDESGSNFSLIPSRAVKYAAFLISYTEISSENLQQAFIDNDVTWVKYIGDNSYSYIAYAKDELGTGWSRTPDYSLKYRAEIISDAMIPDPQPSHFSDAVWIKYIGDNSYFYVAYAEDENGSGFNIEPDFTRKYVATLVTYSEIEGTPTSDDFSDCKWTRYIGRDSYLYIAYASNSQGENWSLIPSDSLKYRAEIHSDTEITNIDSSYFNDAVWVKYIGNNSYPKYAYAEDDSGNGWSKTPDFTRKYVAQIVLYEDREITKEDFPISTTNWVKYIGNNSYVYFAYASDSNGSNFSLTPNRNLGYINYITSYEPLTSITIDLFNQRDWTRYLGIDSYVYVSYAEDAEGNVNWSTIPSFERKYRAEIHVENKIDSLQRSHFDEATWVKYIGIDTYTYVGYAKTSTGDGFSLTPNNELIYRKEIHSEVILNPPIFSDFGTTDWVQIIPQISIGTVVSGTDASVVNIGTKLNPILDIVLPRGQDGIGISPQGEYSQTISYVLNDVVRYGKYLWRCKVETSLGVEPPSEDGVTSNEHWDVWLEDGQTPTISVGEVTVAEGDVPSITNVGSSTAMVLDFALVPGRAATLELGRINTGSPGSSVIINNTGTSYAAVLDITIPRGDNGYYYTPNVNTNGDISWTNNGGLINPEIVNIKGPQGVSYYLYVAYAETSTGTGWSLTPSDNKPYRAEIVLNENKTVTSSDFSGAKWIKYIGNSAYEIWINNGHSGTESDFLDWLRMQSASIIFTNSDLIDKKLNIQASNAVVAIVDNDGYQWQLPQRTVRYLNDNNIEIDLSGIMVMAGLTSITGEWRVMLAGGLTS